MERLPRAVVYLRRGRFYVAPEHRTQYGFGLSGEPVHDLSEASDDSELGSAIQSALDASQVNFFFDRADRNKWPHVQRAAKARSWTQFIKGTKEMLVERRPDGELRLIGLSESVDEPEAVSVTAPGSASAAELGLLVRQVADGTPAHSGRKPYS